MAGAELMAALVTVRVSVELLPAWSLAVTVMILAPACKERLAIDQLVVPVAVPLDPGR